MPIPVGDGSGVEKRIHKRVPLHVPLECRSDQMTIQVEAENISIGGLLVRAEKTFSWDEEISVSFLWPDSKETFQAQARVAHVVPDAFMGVEFIDLPVESKKRIEHYLANPMAPSDKPG